MVVRVYDEYRSFKKTSALMFKDQHVGLLEHTELECWLDAQRALDMLEDEGESHDLHYEKPVIFEEYKIDRARAGTQAFGEALGKSFRGIAAVFGGISDGFVKATTPDPAQAMRDKRIAELGAKIPLIKSDLLSEQTSALGEIHANIMKAASDAVAKDPDGAVIMRLEMISRPQLWREAKRRNLVGHEGDTHIGYSHYTKRALAELIARDINKEK